MEKASILSFALVLLLFTSCIENKTHNSLQALDEALISTKDLKARLDSLGYQTFNYVNSSTNDTVLMQQYFIAFLKIGSNRSQNDSEVDSLQTLHLEHLQRMYDLGYADISGPFGDNGDIRGITIYNVPTLQMADSLANLDPMVKAGRLAIEVHPWWAGKGLPLR